MGIFDIKIATTINTIQDVLNEIILFSNINNFYYIKCYPPFIYQLSERDSDLLIKGMDKYIINKNIQKNILYIPHPHANNDWVIQLSKSLIHLVTHIDEKSGIYIDYSNAFVDIAKRARASNETSTAFQYPFAIIQRI